MGMWTFLTIIIVTSILAGTISEYLKRERKTRSVTDAELEGLRVEAGKLRKRVENLEAIAAGDPEEFSESFKTKQSGYRNSKKKEPAEEINEIIENRRNKSWE